MHGLAAVGAVIFYPYRPFATALVVIEHQHGCAQRPTTSETTLQTTANGKPNGLRCSEAMAYDIIRCEGNAPNSVKPFNTAWSARVELCQEAAPRYAKAGAPSHLIVAQSRVSIENCRGIPACLSPGQAKNSMKAAVIAEEEFEDIKRASTSWKHVGGISRKAVSAQEDMQKQELVLRDKMLQESCESTCQPEREVSYQSLEGALPGQETGGCHHGSQGQEKLARRILKWIEEPCGGPCRFMF